MPRRLLNLLTLLSLLLCAAVIVLWVRSYFTTAYDRISYTGATRVYDLYFHPGRILVSTAPGHTSEDGEFTYESEAAPVSMALFLHELTREPNRWWFSCSSSVHTSGRRSYDIIVPTWAPFLVTAAPSAMYLVSRRRRHRSSRQFCAQCGYDLRATPNQCPECGTPRKPEPAPSVV